MKPSPDGFDERASPRSLAWALGGAVAGVFVALVLLPNIAPALGAALWAPQPKTWWYLSRASGLVAYALLSASMLLGLLLSTRFARGWPGSALAFTLHEHAAILGAAFALFHGLVLLGDRHTPFAIAHVLPPFGAAYRPAAVGLGQLAFYGMALLSGSFYVRKRIGQRTWRWLHHASFVIFALAVFHSLSAGTDRLVVVFASAPLAGVLFFVTFRVLERLFGGAADARPAS